MIKLKISSMEDDNKHIYYGISMKDEYYKNNLGEHIVHFYFWYDVVCDYEKYRPY